MSGLDALTQARRATRPRIIDRATAHTQPPWATSRPDEVSKWQAERAKYPRDSIPQAVGSQAEKK
jgi:hypothetical protein